MNMMELFLGRAQIHPDRPAIISASDSVSYGALDRQSDRLAGAFRDQGIGEGDVVLVLWSAGVPLFRILLALFRMGAVALFPDPSAAMGSLRHATQDQPLGSKHLGEGCCLDVRQHALRRLREYCVVLERSGSRDGE